MPPFPKNEVVYKPVKSSFLRIKDILSTNGLKSPKDIDVARELKLHPNTLVQAYIRIPYPNILDFLQRKQISINLFFYRQNPQEVAIQTDRYKILKLYIANATTGLGGINERIVYKDLILD